MEADPSQSCFSCQILCWVINPLLLLHAVSDSNGLKHGLVPASICGSELLPWTDFVPSQVNGGRLRFQGSISHQDMRRKMCIKAGYIGHSSFFEGIGTLWGLRSHEKDMLVSRELSVWENIEGVEQLGISKGDSQL